MYTCVSYAVIDSQYKFENKLTIRCIKFFSKENILVCLYNHLYECACIALTD